MFQDLLDDKWTGENAQQVFYPEEDRGKRTGGEEPRGPNGHGPRGQGIWLHGAYPLAPRSPFRRSHLKMPSSRQKRDALFFPRFIEVAAAAKPLSHSRGVRSYRSRAPEKGEIAAIFTTSPPWHRGRHLHHQD
jgi:hypothetical protein